MAEACIPVDLRNPGQVFACLGLVEAADILLGGATGGFDWSGPPRFRLAALGDVNPVAEVLQFLAEAEMVAVAPDGSGLAAEKWGVTTEPPSDPEVFPYPLPDSPATLPMILRRKNAGGDTCVIEIAHWGDATRRDTAKRLVAGRDNVKFWAGAGGYPGAALARDARALIPGAPGNLVGDPFGFQAPQSSSFRFDWRRDYIPLDAGFSPNEHGAIVMIGYPIVELFAAIGLAHARPRRTHKLLYRYATPGIVGDTLYPLALLRAVLGAPDSLFPGLPLRRFAMSLDWPGQENQARAITDVIEETER